MFLAVRDDNEKKKHYMAPKTDCCKDVDMNGGILTADPLRSDYNLRHNSLSHHTLILPVVGGSVAADADTLIRGLTGTRHRDESSLGEIYALVSTVI